MPWGWWVVNAIGTDATSFQDESRVSFATRSAIVDRMSAGAAGHATAAKAIAHVRMWRMSATPLMIYVDIAYDATRARSGLPRQRRVQSLRPRATRHGDGIVRLGSRFSPEAHLDRCARRLTPRFARRGGAGVSGPRDDEHHRRPWKHRGAELRLDRAGGDSIGRATAAHERVRRRRSLLAGSRRRAIRALLQGWRPIRSRSLAGA